MFNREEWNHKMHNQSQTFASPKAEVLRRYASPGVIEVACARLYK